MKHLLHQTIAQNNNCFCTTRLLASNVTGKTIRTFIVLFFGLAASLSSYAQNAIVTENNLPGSPATEWDINGAGDLSIQGFATDISVNKGTTVHFKIKTDASAYTITIYRLGYYGGNGARNVGTGVITASLPQTQPADLYDANTGLTDCGNWSESAHWDVPANAVSGLYLARLKKSNGAASHIAFIVRDDASHSDLFFQTSDATWQAYNVYGGNSLYVGSTSLPSGHASKVSYNRPFLTRNGGGGGGAAEDWLFNSEYPMIRWLERNGYDMTYTTDVDVARRGNLIINHKAFLSVGHDEYWSAEQRNSVEAARAAGVHLGFFSGNEIYWKTRWENSTDGSNTPYRTLVCYKEGTLGEAQCNQKCDPLPNVWTGLWRDGDEATYGSNDGHKPENALSGQISWDGNTGTMQVPDTYKSLRFWRNTSIANLSAGQTATLTANTLGYEWDWEQYTSNYPAGRITLSSTTFDGHTHKLSLYKYSSGALVFGAGTVQWSWGLDGTHDRGSSVPNKDMQQATVNLFADMGVQPATLQSGLVAAAAYTDITAPTSIITSPSGGASLPRGTTVTITGTASDIGGAVGGIEVSVDGGATWQPATGTTNWTFVWTPTTQGSVTIKSRSVDDIGNLEASNGETSANSVTVTVGDAQPVVCPCTVFQPTDVPTNPKENDRTSIELGFKFKTSEDGYITSIRFYKGAGTTGTHSGHLWSRDGTQLATVTFTAESASGWQEAALSNPVAVTAGTTYVASIFSSSGDYAFTNPYFTQPTINGPLTALANGDDGPNGVYKYTSSSAFPSDNYQTSNYWVDVVFNTNVGPDNTPPLISSTVPANGAVGVTTNSVVKINFNEAMDAATLTSATIKLLNQSNAEVPATISYNSSTHSTSITPSSALSYSGNYSVLIKGGSSDPRVKDLAGNALVSNYTFAFSTAAPPPPPPTEGPGGPILIVSSASNPFSRYPVEILRAEGLNEFKAMDISAVDAATLANYDVVILGEMSLSSSQIALFTNWVNNGGTFISFKPDAQLSSLLGIAPSGSSSLSDKYLLVNTATVPGAGIVNETIQYHGAADLYTLNGAISIATLYSNATTATTYPAVTMKSVGTNGGVAVAFAYDLARSVVYTRQGNPAWAGQKRDGQIDPIRSDDQFYPDWIDFNKIAIPQADEQQHLLTNLIIKNNLHRKPLPKFWFLPKGLKAAVVMTGDDHGDAGMKPRFDIDISESPVGCSVDDWECVRSTGYLYVGSTFTNEQAKQYTDLGFEVALHVNTNCQNFTPGEYQDFITTQSQDFHTAFPDIAQPSTNRNHCIAWSDWSTVPEVEAANGMRLDVNYYYWPGSWIQNRPGMFTGSGMPMRFAKIDGSIIDCYQAVTQMPDESDETFPQFSDALLDKAIGPQGYYGVFTTNMHFDNPNHPGANAVVASAKARGVPVVSAKQMLTWLDGRNSSSFGGITWSNNTLQFSIAQGTGAKNLRGMLPVIADNGQLTGIIANGSSISFNKDVIKGIEYGFFEATAGNYVATYAVDNTPPIISQVLATPHNDGTATITWITDKASDSKVDFGRAANTLTRSANETSFTTNHTITLDTLMPGETYYYRVTSADASANTATQPILSNAALNFTMPSPPCINDITAADFGAGTIDANTAIVSAEDGEVILKPAMSEDFGGNTIPSSFTEGVFNAGGTTVSNGLLTVSGTHIYSNNSIAAGSSIEFVATFNAGRFQNIGISADQPFNNNPWIVIGQGSNADGNLYARSSNGDAITLGSNLLGTPHHFMIKWNTNNFEFYVDGNATPSATIAFTITQNMFVQISDVFSDDGSLSVDWLRVLPYAFSGSYTSRIFDGGTSKKWGAVTWNADVPSAASLAISVRTGNTAVPDGSWTSFVSIATSGNSAGSTSRYIQYKADLQTTDASVTPVLKSLSISCSEGNTLPVVTKQPLSQTICSGSNALFSSSATGKPSPNVQWQVSTNGTSWTDIAGATDSLLTTTVTTADNGKKYHAVWSNTEGTATSSTATMTVNASVTASLFKKVNPSCKNNDGSVTLTGSGGKTPYQYALNGGTYQTSNIFNGLAAGTYIGTVKEAMGCTSTVTNIVLTNTVVTVNATKTASSTCTGDGTITLTASGGAAPFTYSLDGSNFAATNKFSNLIAGTYTGYAKDAKGCIGILGNIIVTSIAPVTVRASKTTTSVCLSDGTITLTAAGGRLPYTYSLDGIAFVSSNKFTSLPAGTYTGYVKDAKGCVGSLLNIIVNSVAPVTVKASVSAASSCKDDGSITLSVSGGNAPYLYSINGTDYFSSNKFINLPAGTYTGYAKDAKGCIGSLSNIIVTNRLFTSTASKTNVTCTGANNGTITVNKAGGFSPFLYSIDGLNFVATNKFSNLSPGTYTTIAKDAKGCTATVSGIVIAESSKPCSNNLIADDVTSKSLDESPVALEVMASPNPSQHDFVLTVKSSKKESVEVRVMDMYGRIVYRTKGDGNQSYRFGDGFAAGSYIVEVMQSTDRKIVKIIKQ